MAVWPAPCASYRPRGSLWLWGVVEFEQGTTHLMHITHHGARNGVTGSCHQLHFNDKRSLLIDCGSFQGKDAKNRDEQVIEFSLEGIQALLVTHVHIDHIGRIPYLLEAGFRGPIYCTKPTAKLIPLMLEDAIRLGITRKQNVIDDFLKGVKQLLRPLPYDKWEKLDGGSQIRFQQAGHVLGSAYIEVEYGEERFVFSGDLGSRETPLLRDPVSPERADVLVLESTYGNRIHEGREERTQNLEDILCRTLSNRGVTIIPAFSLGRTQELLYELNRIFENIEHKTKCPLLGNVDVIVDSPLANRLTVVYNEMREYWDEEAQKILQIDDQPLVFKNLIEIDRPGEHRGTVEYLKQKGLPAVVIAGSGMCTGGRVVNYLKEFIGRETTDIVFVGYQAEGTPGRYIIDSDWVRLDGKQYTIRAKVHSLSGYSAHADQQDLMRFVRGIPTKPREIRLVHGEEKAQKALAELLTQEGYFVT